MSNAPIIAWSPETGHRLATDTERSAFLKDEALEGLNPTWSLLPGGVIVRRLSCSDPLDMRAIWYYAAIGLHYSHAEAVTATILYRHLGAPAYGLFLQVDPLRTSTPFSKPPPLAWIKDLGVASGLVAATEALCTAVWGPK